MPQISIRPPKHRVGSKTKPGRVHVVSGGPFNRLFFSVASNFCTLPFTVRGMSGRYVGKKWQSN